MPPTDRFVCTFAAEPPQDGLPYGRWADRLRVEFLAACLRIDDEGEDLGEAGEIVWYPDRTYHGRTYVPASTRTSTGYELYGYVSFFPGTEDEDPSDVQATADFTAETADANPDWKLDLCEDVIGSWRGEDGNVAAMTLVWGRPLVEGGAIATAELADLNVDQCVLSDGRFTLIAPDNYRHDILDIKLFSTNGTELARESLYEDDGDEDSEGAVVA
ncbi:MAG: hypothetical protein JWN65_701 [Solirubrobacterales bacterium]|jgi:hypothetical protein|nr:hypothetical protein [Solirubrobacterales bacterium]